MIWLTWRQHRHQLYAALAVLATLGAAYAVLRRSLVSYVQDSGLRTCLALPDQGCGHLVSGLVDHYPGLLDLLPYLNLVPALAGVFVGATLVTRELDHGTQRLVWSQSVSRRRWLLSKLAMLAIGAIAFGLLFGALNRWLLTPYTQGAAVSTVAQNFVGLTGVAPAAVVLLAVALGTAAGALIRRPLPAMAATLIGFVALRLTWESLRYRLFPPMHAIVDVSSAVPVGPGRYDWILPVSPWVDASGAPIDDSTLNGWCGQAPAKEAFMNCLAVHNVHQATYWEPASRYWTFQWLDVAVFGGAAVVLLAVTVVLTLRTRV
jgi:hypothetical protein